LTRSAMRTDNWPSGAFMRIRRLPAVLLLLSGSFKTALPALPAELPKPVMVFTAASTADAVEKIGKAYTGRTGTPVLVSSGASPALAQQILKGAPADVFIPAGGGVLVGLLKAGMVDEGSSFPWVLNRLVVIAPADAGAAPASPWEIADPRFRRLALADPDLVPAGMYARQSLTFFGIWEDVRRRVVPAPDVRSALAYVESGEADLGIVYATDARATSRVKVVLELPEVSHNEIRYPVALVAHPGSSPAARPFMEFLRGNEARKILVEAGFTPAFP